MNELKLVKQGTWICNPEQDYAFKIAPQGGAVMSVQQRIDLASRIVACVNACTGFDTQGLALSVELGDTLPVMRDRMIKSELELRMQRDQLLSALEGLLHEEGGTIGMAAGNPKAVAARAAIARVKGGAA